MQNKNNYENEISNFKLNTIVVEKMKFLTKIKTKRKTAVIYL